MSRLKSWACSIRLSQTLVHRANAFLGYWGSHSRLRIRIGSSCGTSGSLLTVSTCRTAVRRANIGLFQHGATALQDPGLFADQPQNPFALQKAFEPDRTEFKLPVARSDYERVKESDLDIVVDQAYDSSERSKVSAYHNLS